MGAKISQIKSGPPAYRVQFRRLRDPRWLPALLWLYLIIGLPYIVWRAGVINWHIWYGPLVYLAELYGVLTTALFLFVTQKIYVPVPRPFRPGRTVDIFITTYNEPLAIIEPTLAAATRVRHVNKILLLDDGNRSQVSALAKRYGTDYFARTTNEFAKAGNLNNGLGHSTAEFILELDADHIPLPNFVEKTLGFFDDPAVGFVQTPQTYYNHDSFLFRRTRKRLWSEQCMFYDTIQVAKNRWNSAFFVGTSALLRRAAIDSVGGFATGTATEDIHTSLRLHAKGWRSVFLPEALAFGLEAANLKEFYKQRRRWAAGSLGLLMRSPDSPLRIKGLKLQQRLNYLSATLAHLAGLQKLFFFMVPALCALTLVGPVTVNYAYFNYIFSAYVIITLSIVMVYARGTYHLIHTEAYSLANMMAHLGGLKGVIKVQRKFAVSRKIVARAERTWLKGVLWTLAAIGTATILRSAFLTENALLHHSGLALGLSSLIFETINFAGLASFMIYLARYERSDQPEASPESHAVANPYLVSLFGETLEPESVEAKD